MAIMQVPCTKSKGTVEIDTEKLPDAVYAEALLQGLKVLINRGMSKVTKETYPQAEEMKTKAQEVAEKNREDLLAGKVRITGGAKTKGISGAVKTEAMRLARNLVKDEIKKAGGKISHYEASEITKAAKALLEQDTTLLDMAKANLEERAKVPVSINVAGIAISSKKVAAAEAKKAKAGTLSATQAGLAKPRAKGQQASTQH